MESEGIRHRACFRHSVESRILGIWPARLGRLDAAHRPRYEKKVFLRIRLRNPSGRPRRSPTQQWQTPIPLRPTGLREGALFVYSAGSGGNTKPSGNISAALSRAWLPAFICIAPQFRGFGRIPGPRSAELPHIRIHRNGVCSAPTRYVLRSLSRSAAGRRC